MNNALKGKGGKMKAQIINQVKRGGNRVLMSITAIVAVVAFIPSSVAMAWGPDRPTYTMDKPADHVTFNSITDNSTIGDERDFVRVREQADGAKFSNEVTVYPGKEYEVYIGYHNNAAENLNSSANGGKGIALGAMVSTQFPSEVTPEKRGVITATITAENSDPKSVWDEAFMKSDSDVLLRYKPASAKIHNRWDANGTILPQNIFEESGTYLGMNELNGVLNGCFKFSGYITYTLIAENVDATLVKTVSRDGNNYYKNVDARGGEEVTYKIEFKNTGSKDLTNVGFKDLLPDGMELVPGTTIIYDNAHESGEKLSDLIASSGYNLGEYGAGTYATIYYKARVKNNAECGKGLVNKIMVNHDKGALSDGATVNVQCDNNVPTELPSTGPAQIVGAVVIVGGIGVLAVYWYRSQMALKEIGKSKK